MIDTFYYQKCLYSFLTWRLFCLKSAGERQHDTIDSINIFFLALTFNWQNINKDHILSIGCIDLYIFRSLQLWFYPINYLKISWSHSPCVLKKEPGFGQGRMFIKTESKIHVIISVLPGAMVLIAAGSSISSSLSSWK